MEPVDKKIAEEASRLLFSIKAITLSPKKPYRYTSGILSPIYCDNRLAISFPYIRNKLINFYLQLIEEHVGKENIDFVSGTATAAVPHATFIADDLNCPMVYVEISKNENKEGEISGNLPRDKKVVIIEDHISTGGSAIGNTLAIRNAGGTVKECFATTNYLMKKAELAFKKAGVKLYCLTNINSILEIAVEDGYLKEKEMSLVKAWTEDPAGWGKKMGFE